MRSSENLLYVSAEDTYSCHGNIINSHVSYIFSSVGSQVNPVWQKILSTMRQMILLFTSQSLMRRININNSY